MPRQTNMNTKTRFGIIISNRLKEIDKTQKDFAQEIGRTQVYVYKLLNGLYNPSVKTLCKISKVTGIGMEELTKALLDKS